MRTEYPQVDLVIRMQLPCGRFIRVVLGVGGGGSRKLTRRGWIWGWGGGGGSGGFAKITALGRRLERNLSPLAGEELTEKEKKNRAPERWNKVPEEMPKMAGWMPGCPRMERGTHRLQGSSDGGVNMKMGRRTERLPHTRHLEPLRSASNAEWGTLKLREGRALWDKQSMCGSSATLFPCIIIY